MTTDIVSDTDVINALSSFATAVMESSKAQGASKTRNAKEFRLLVPEATDAR